MVKVNPQAQFFANIKHFLALATLRLPPKVIHTPYLCTENVFVLICLTMEIRACADSCNFPSSFMIKYP